MIDLHKPHFSSAQVAKACGLPPTTLRTYFARGQFRVLGDTRERSANGLPHLFSLRDALGLAVTVRLMEVANIPASDAFNIGMIKFAHSGSDVRNPGTLLDVRQRGETLLVYYPDTGRVEFVGEDAANLCDLLPSPAASVCIIRLNHVIARTCATLGFDPASVPMTAEQGSEQAPQE